MSNERPKLPPEAVELYTRYVHGEISRRDFLNGAEEVRVLGLTAGAIVDALMPNYALGAAGVEDRRPHQGELRDRPVAAGERQHQGLPRAPVQRRHARTRRRPSCPASSSCTRIGA